MKLKFTLLFLLISLLSLCQVDTTKLNIISWNIQNFGRSKSESDSVMKYITSKVKIFDIVVVQEVSTSEFGAQAVAEMMSGNEGDGASLAIQQAAKAGQVGVIKNILGKIGVDPNAVSQNIAGKIANPYLQQIFQGVGMRQFDFNWKLVPRNEGEQKSIHNIIKTLRANVLPGFSDDFTPNQATDSIGDLLSPNLENNEGFKGKQSVDRWLTLPNIFNLKWKYEGGEIDSLPKLKQCVCKNISVQYTPDGVWASRIMNGKPQPIAYNLTMSFGEMSIVTNEDVITKGY